MCNVCKVEGWRVGYFMPVDTDFIMDHLNLLVKYF